MLTTILLAAFAAAGPSQELIAAWGGPTMAKNILGFTQSNPRLALESFTEKIIEWDALLPGNDLFNEMKLALQQKAKDNMTEYSRLKVIERVLVDMGRENDDPILINIREQMLAVGPDITPPVAGTVTAPANQNMLPFDITFVDYTDAEQGPNHGIKEYRLLYRKDSGKWKAAPLEPILQGESQTFTVTQMAGGGVYDWVIIALDNTGNASVQPEVAEAQATTVYTP